MTPPAQDPDRPGERSGPARWPALPAVPGWLWIVLSCLVGLTAAVVVLHLTHAARHLPG